MLWYINTQYSVRESSPVMHFSVASCRPAFWKSNNIVRALKFGPSHQRFRLQHPNLHRCDYFRTHKWTNKASLSGTSFISIFALTIFTHREGLSGSTPVPDNNVNSSTLPNQCATQQGIYGVTSRVFILVLLGKDYDEGAIHRRLINWHFGVPGPQGGGITFDPDHNMEEVVTWRYACRFDFNPPSIVVLPSPYSELDQKLYLRELAVILVTVGIMIFYHKNC